MKQLADLLCFLVGGGSALLGMWLAGGDEALADALAMSEDEARAIADPAARLMAQSKAFRRYGRRLVQGQDWIALTLAVGSYGLRIAPLVQQRLADRTSGHVTRRASQPVSPREQRSGNAGASNGHQPAAQVISGFYSADI